MRPVRRLQAGSVRTLLVNDKTSYITMDDNRPLEDICTAYLATLVDTKNFLERLEDVFCKVLCPAIFRQTDKFESSSIELQKSVGQTKDENARLLSKNVALQSELEKEKSRFDIAVQKAVEGGMDDKLQKSLHEIHELQGSLKRCQGGTDELQQRLHSLQEENQNVKEGQQKLMGENEELRQRVNVFEEENQELRRRQGAQEEKSRVQQNVNTLQQENSRLAGVAEHWEKESDLLKFKMAFLEKENQRLNKSRGETEKLQTLNRNRLTLKREALPRSSKLFSPQNGKSPEQALAARTEKENRNDRDRDEDTTLSPRDVGAEAEAALTPPQLNNDVDNKAKKSPVAGNVGDSTMSSSRLAGKAEAPKSAVPTDVCKQEADEFKAPNAPPGVVDSDETVMDITQSNNVGEAEAALTPPQIKNDVDNKQRSPRAGSVGDSKRLSLRRAGIAEGPKSVVSTDMCKQEADDFKAPDAPPGVVDSDETVMDITQPNNVGKAEAALIPPQINNDVDNKAERSPLAGKVGNSTTVSSRLAGILEDLKSVVSTDVSKQEADDFKAPNAPPSGIDSDETVMDSTQRDNVGDVSEIPSVIPVAIQNQTADHLQLSTRPHASTEAGVSDAGEVPANRTRTCLKSGFTRSITPEVVAKGRDVEATSKVHVWTRRRTQVKSRTGDRHDDFLDTPLERIRAQNLAGRHEHGESVHSSVSKHVSHLSVDNGRLQDGMKPEVKGKQTKGVLEQNIAPHLRSKSDVSNGTVPNSKRKNTPLSKKAGGYKFNEPVRRKRDRENLAATDCRQCSKFYNALEADDVNGVMPLRCDHRDAVSRHRYQNIPPPTPEGFWNIGFSDSE